MALKPFDKVNGLQSCHNYFTLCDPTSCPPPSSPLTSHALPLMKTSRQAFLQWWDLNGTHEIFILSHLMQCTNTHKHVWKIKPPIIWQILKTTWNGICNPWNRWNNEINMCGRTWLFQKLFGFIIIIALIALTRIKWLH